MESCFPHRKGRTSGQKFLIILTALVLLATAAGGLLSSVKPASANASPQSEARPQPAPTATPPSSSMGGRPGVSPVIGILILLAPMIFLVWKSRGVKEPKIRASCCLPVIDENKRPFKIEEDDPAARQPGTN